ncbi:MAG: hypothetical protein ACK5WK_02725, partial [Hyphomonadaceae bacterium]
MTRAFLPTPATPLRQRMIEDMTWRGFQDKTQRGFIRIASAFAEFQGELLCAPLWRWLISLPALAML